MPSAKDAIGLEDQTYVMQTRVPGPINHPCPKCGKGSRVRHKPTERICASALCRYEFTEAA